MKPQTTFTHKNRNHINISVEPDKPKQRMTTAGLKASNQSLKIKNNIYENRQVCTQSIRNSYAPQSQILEKLGKSQRPRPQTAVGHSTCPNFNEISFFKGKSLSKRIFNVNDHSSASTKSGRPLSFAPNSQSIKIDLHKLL